MKRVVKASVTKGQKALDLNIDITYIDESAYSYETNQIAASSDFKNASEFWEFIENVAAILDARDFNIVDHHKTDRKNSLSYYFSFYPVDEDGNMLDEYLINFRISTHYIKGLYSKSRNHYNKLAKENKPEGKKFQKYRIKEIIVGKYQYTSYGETLRQIEDICDELMNSNYDAMFN